MKNENDNTVVNENDISNDISEDTEKELLRELDMLEERIKEIHKKLKY